MAIQSKIIILRVLDLSPVYILSRSSIVGRWLHQYLFFMIMIIIRIIIIMIIREHRSEITS